MSEIVEIDLSEEPTPPPVKEMDGANRKCTVCMEPAAGMYFGALVCLPCKSFFIRSTKDGEPIFKCIANNVCLEKPPFRLRCQYCRYKKCIEAGMCRKERPETVAATDGQELCKVCGDLANGIHFGVYTCEGCKKFFRRGLKESNTYICKVGGNCVINPRNRNDCRYCRFQKCFSVGMSREAIKIGRPKRASGSSERIQPKSNGKLTDTTITQSQNGYKATASGICQQASLTGNPPNIPHDQPYRNNSSNIPHDQPYRNNSSNISHDESHPMEVEMDVVECHSQTGNNILESILKGKMVITQLPLEKSKNLPEEVRMETDDSAVFVGSCNQKSPEHVGLKSMPYKTEASQSSCAKNSAAFNAESYMGGKVTICSPNMYAATCSSAGYRRNVQHYVKDSKTSEDEGGYKNSDTPEENVNTLSNLSDEDVDVLLSFIEHQQEKIWPVTTQGLASQQAPVTSDLSNQLIPSSNPATTNQSSLPGFNQQQQPNPVSAPLTANHSSLLSFKQQQPTPISNPVTTHNSSLPNFSQAYFNVQNVPVTNQATVSNQNMAFLNQQPQFTSPNVQAPAFHPPQCHGGFEQQQQLAEANMVRTLSQPYLQTGMHSGQNIPAQQTSGFLPTSRNMASQPVFPKPTIATNACNTVEVKTSWNADHHRHQHQNVSTSPVSGMMKDLHVNPLQSENGTIYGSKQGLITTTAKFLGVHSSYPQFNCQVIDETIKFVIQNGGRPLDEVVAMKQRISSDGDQRKPLINYKLFEYSDEHSGSYFSGLKRKTSNTDGLLDQQRKSQRVNGSSTEKQVTKTVPPNLVMYQINCLYFNPDYWYLSGLSDGFYVQMTSELQELLEFVVKEYLDMLDICDERDLPKTNENANLEKQWPSDNKGQWNHWLHVQRRIIRNTTACSQFSENIPGFKSIKAKDKVLLLKRCGFQLALILAGKEWFIPEKRTFNNFWNWELKHDHPMFLLRKEIVATGEMIHRLGLDNVEAALLGSLLVCATDWHDLESKEYIEQIRQPLLMAFCAHCTDKYGPNTKRPQELLECVPYLRYVSIWHNEMLAFMKGGPPPSGAPSESESGTPPNGVQHTPPAPGGVFATQNGTDSPPDFKNKPPGFGSVPPVSNGPANFISAPQGCIGMPTNVSTTSTYGSSGFSHVPTCSTSAVPGLFVPPGYTSAAPGCEPNIQPSVSQYGMH